MNIGILIVISLFCCFNTKYLSFDIIESDLTEVNSDFVSFIERFPVQLNQYKLPAIGLSIGTLNQSFNFLINTFSSKLYIPENDGFSCQMSETCVDLDTEITLNFLGPNVKGKLLSDNLILPNNKTIINRFRFVNIENFKYRFDYIGMIGLDYLQNVDDRDIENPLQYSLLSMLFAIDFIDKQMFTIGRIEKDKEKIVFGEFPIKTTKKNYHTCNLIQKNKEGKFNSVWKCTLNSIFFDDNTIYPVNEEIAFGIGFNKITCDKKFFEYIQEKYFKDAIKKGECNISKNGQYNEFIVCKESYNNDNLGTFSFVIGKWNIKIKTKELWRKNESIKQKIFLIVYHQEKKFIWSISYPFLREKYALVFDRDKDIFGLINLNLDN